MWSNARAALDRLLNQLVGLLCHKMVQTHADGQQNHRKGDECLLEPQFHASTSSR